VVFCQASARSEDFTTLDGKIYVDVQVLRSSATTVTIRHAKGIAEIPFSNLPEEIRAKCGRTKEEEAALLVKLREAMEAQSAARSIVAAATIVTATMRQVIPDGALADVRERREYVRTNVVTKMTGGRSSAFVSPFNQGTYEVGRASATAVDSVEVSTTVDYVTWTEPVFIIDLPDYVVDGDTWDGAIWYLGTCDYTTVAGAPKRVRKYTASAERAAAIYAPQKRIQTRPVPRL
jgi:hypothetical protein